MNKEVIALASNIGNMVSVSRRVRKIKQADLAAMSGVGMNTMVSIEKGETTVQLGLYLQVLSALGITDILKPIVDQTADTTGISTMANLLPKRVMGKRKSRRNSFEAA